uniref:Adaptor protein, phosphotyrosine interaction, PH domain and leucine zipper containing 2 n=1 Tax=Neogobius melanostomus TaxID=47308 RepID=A0A8C6WRS4_9GOBI
MFLKVCEPLDKLIHSLIVFEEDALNLTDYTNKLLQTMQRVFGAQSEMGLATEQLAQQLLDYEKKNFALGKGDEEVITTLQSFAKTVGELNSLHSALANQMADNMVFPLIQFREKDLTEISTLKEIHGIATDEHEAAMVKYSRLPKKRENEKMKTDMVKEVAYTRRKQHQASLQYYCALNALQYRKRVAMLEPMLGYTQAQISFFKKGIEQVSKRWTTSSPHIQTQLDSEAEAMRSTQRELLSVDDSIYTPDSNAVSVNRTLIQKAGYLNIRNKTGLVTTAWDRLYFFTQGGNLMCQPRGAVAGGMVLDLDNSSVMAIECEDRRYCFQITSSTGKTSMILQAESKKEYEEWICTVNNISRQIYLTDNPEVSRHPITSFEKRQEGAPNPDRAKPGGVHVTGGSQKSAPEPEDLIAPGTPIQFDITLPASEFMDQNRGGRRTNPFGETDDECLAESDDSLLQQVFAVRFLGSMAVRCGNNQEVIYEAMRQVLAARAIHNIFKTTESHLMVTSNDIRLIDPQTQVNKITVSPRLGRGEEAGQTAFSAYIFESNTEGEKVCYTINLAKDITEAKKDPEALAQLMKNMPFTNDGKFLLLESETGEEPDGASQEDLESEA